MDKKALRALVPGAKNVKVNGSEIVVATTAEDAKLLDQIVAAQIRDILQSSIKHYKDKEVALTPKELKDLADAGKALAQFSAEVYKEAGAQDKPSPPVPVTPNTDDFEVLDKKEEKNETNSNRSPDSSGAGNVQK